MRKLASIREIKELIPIQNKDRIELAIVDGWSVIVSKGLYKVGDKTIYVEIDSILPEKPEFEFLRDKHFRIKTMKMAGVISQGICFPLSILPEGKYELGDDVTEILGVTKYESESEKEDNVKIVKEKFKNPVLQYLMKYKLFRMLILPKKQNKGFPEFLSKTNEERIQNLPHLLHNKQPFIVHEKLNGTSSSYVIKKHKSKLPLIKDKYEYMVCSRNLRLNKKDTIKSYWAISEKYNMEKVLRDLIDNFGVEWIAIQGEIIGNKIQGNPYKINGYDFYVFNVITSSGKIRCYRIKNLLLNEYNLKWCPLVEEDFILPDNMNDILKYADGKSKLYDILREGVVVRSYDEKISFKIISNEHLLQNNS